VGADPIVTQSLSGSKLTVTLDKKWLDKQAFEKFPLRIDPTFTSYSAPNNWYVNYKSDGFVCNPGQGCGNSTGSVSNKYWRFMYHVDFSALQGKYLRSTLFHVEMPDCT